MRRRLANLEERKQGDAAVTLLGGFAAVAVKNVVKNIEKR